ncbi:MAG: ATP synthase F1 subunit delta [Candidatus Omnitrophica bacterium]|nr:ATP synthase F1 subunit delta [Candidatus Omnitrophota bacterium]
MIKERAVVIRYAEAFISCARKSVGLEQALMDINMIKGLIRDNPELKKFLEAIDISAYEKEQLIKHVLLGQVSEDSLNFLKLLLEKKRIYLFLDIVEYLRLTYAHEGEEMVVLRTSFPLDLELIKRLEDKLMQRYGKRFKFYIDLDGSLLGGAQVVIGNTVIDGSVRMRLLDLKNKLKGTEVH